MPSDDVVVDFTKTDDLTKYHKDRYFHALAMFVEDVSALDVGRVNQIIKSYDIKIKDKDGGTKTVAIDFPKRLNQETLPEAVRPSNRPRGKSSGGRKK